MNRLHSKTAIVTGGSLGIGRACVERLAEEGARVAIFDVLDESRALAAEPSERRHEVAFWQMDMADETAVKTAVDAVAARFGSLNVLVNNAGVSGAAKQTHEVTEAEWDSVQAVNVKGVFFGTKHAIPHLRAAKGGSIINCPPSPGWSASAA